VVTIEQELISNYKDNRVAKPPMAQLECWLTNLPNPVYRRREKTGMATEIQELSP
jgi:hypothetical protein